MKAGDKVIWTDGRNNERLCEIVAVFNVDDAINKNIVGDKVYRVTCDGFDFHALAKDLRPL